jgi:hypothetical protein
MSSCYIWIKSAKIMRWYKKIALCLCTYNMETRDKIIRDCKLKTLPINYFFVFCKNWFFHTKLLPITSCNFNWGGPSSSFVTSNGILSKPSMTSPSCTRNHPTSMVVPWCTHACPPILGISHVAITASLVGLIKNTQSRIWNCTSTTIGHLGHNQCCACNWFRSYILCMCKSNNQKKITLHVNVNVEYKMCKHKCKIV